MADTHPQQGARVSTRRPWANLLSSLLFIAALGFAVAALYFYMAGDTSPGGDHGRAHATPGQNDAYSVLQAIRAQDLDADFGRYTASCDQLHQPGQILMVGDTRVIVFIYTDAAAREADSKNLNTDTVQLTSHEADVPLNKDLQVHAVQHNNLIVMVVGGDASLTEKVDAAIKSLT